MTVERKKIKLALQGGGSHGAFTWGVLERLLEEESIDIVGISGASAGAVNAVCFIDGYAKGGREGAKNKLSELWNNVSKSGFFSPFRTTYFDNLMDNWSLDYSPYYMMFESFKSSLSPYCFNPLGYNPLNTILDDIINFDQVNKFCDIKLYVTATNVKKSTPHIFYQPHISSKVIMASALLPTIQPAIEINGEFFWDGGFTANPSLLPLIENSYGIDDIVIVNLNNIIVENVPKSINEIHNRISEITFNSAMVKELRIILLLQNYIKKGRITIESDRRIYIHSIRGLEDNILNSKSSKYNVEMKFLQYLKDIGRDYTDKWIKENWKHVGNRTTFNFRDLLDIEVTKDE